MLYFMSLDANDFDKKGRTGAKIYIKNAQLFITHSLTHSESMQEI